MRIGLGFLATPFLLVCAGSCATGGEWASTRESARGRVGQLALGLTVGDAYEINSVHYEISGSGLSLSGELALSGTGDKFSASIPEIPLGLDYLLRLTATPVGNADVGCVGSELFDVGSSAPTVVDVVLSCDELDRVGAATVSGSINICPGIRNTEITPLLQAIGDNVTMKITARNLDEGPSPLTFSWKASAGELTGTDKDSAVLRCTSTCTADVEVEVSDGQCTRSAKFVANCVEAIPVERTTTEQDEPQDDAAAEVDPAPVQEADAGSAQDCDDASTNTNTNTNTGETTDQAPAGDSAL